MFTIVKHVCFFLIEQMLDDIERADGMVKELETRRMEKKKEVIINDFSVLTQ